MNEALRGLLGRSAAPDPERSSRAAEIGDLVRTALALPEQAAVTVQQLACTEPGCPPIETKIAVLGMGSARRWTLHTPLSEVADSDVRRLLDQHPEGEDTT